MTQADNLRSRVAQNKGCFLQVLSAAVVLIVVAAVDAAIFAVFVFMWYKW